MATVGVKGLKQMMAMMMMSYTPMCCGLCLQLQRCLSEITECCRTGDGNLLALSIDAARARATVGEITDAMEAVFGRHVATGRLVSGAYKTEYGDAEELANISKRVEVGTVFILTSKHYSNNDCVRV